MNDRLPAGLRWPAALALLCACAIPAPAHGDEAAPMPHAPDRTAATDAAAAAGPERSNTVFSTSASGFVTYRVYATQYYPNTSGSVEVAVPDKCVKFAALGSSSSLANAGCSSGYALNLDYRVILRRDTGESATIPVKDVGPWNTSDNYWDPAGGPRPRRLFTDLAQGTPEAQAAFYNAYNTISNCKKLDGSFSGHAGAADQFDRCVLNPAGIDISPAAAAQIGLASLHSEWLTVTFLWEPTGAGPPARPALARGATRFLRNTLSSGAAETTYSYGVGSDVAVSGDWDGNGSRTPGVFRNGTWYLRNANSSGTGDVTTTFGQAGDIPIAGHWSGPGRDSIGVVRTEGSSLRWFLLQNVADPSSITTFSYGQAGDLPVAGDWTGVGADHPGVFRNGTWYLRNSNTTGVADGQFVYGMGGDVPVVGDWTGAGADRPGVFRNGTWYLRYSTTSGAADTQFVFGSSGDTALTWG